MKSIDLNYLSNIFVAYQYGSYITLNDSWKGYNLNCNYSKFYYIMEGECEIKTGTNTYHGIPGRLFYIPAGLTHSYYHINNNYLTKYWFHFQFEMAGESLEKKYALPLFVDIPQGDNSVRDCFDVILKPCNTLASALRRNASIIELFSIYLNYCDKSESIAYTDKNSLDYLLEYIKKHLNDKPTIEELAAELHLHPNYFIRMFKSKMGMTPGRYMNNLRSEKAKDLLKNTTIPVKQVMQKVGFYDSCAFSNFFKNSTGYSPNNFRKLFSDM